MTATQLGLDQAATCWPTARLADVCQINPGKPKADILPADAPVTFVPMSAVDEILGSITAPEERPFANVRGSYTAFRNGDVLFAKITPCMENGKAAIATGLTNGLGFGSSEFHVLRPSALVLPEFIYQFVRQRSFRQVARENMTGSVGQARVPTDWLKEVEIPLPSVDEQRRIVSLIRSLQQQTESTRDRLAGLPTLLKKFRQSVLIAACSGQLTGDWRRIDGEVETNEIGNIPRSWRVEPFGSVIVELRNGVPPRPEMNPPGVPILRISSTRAMSVDLSDVRYLPEGQTFLPQFALRDGDLLFTRYNGSLELLGVCGMVKGLNKTPLLYPDKLMRVRVIAETLLPAYAQIYFSAPGARERMTLSSRSTAGQQGVSGKDVKAQPIAIPPFDEQTEIVLRVESLFALADSIEARLDDTAARVGRTTQAILAKAFRGEVISRRVPQGELDE